MRIQVFAVLLVATAAVVVASCSEAPPPRACVPGKSEACAGEGGCSGFQVCNSEGTAFEACACPAGTADSGTNVAPDAGEPDAGARTDAGVDGGQTTCNPTALPGQSGCGAGEKCTWILVADTPAELGRVGCVANGTVPLDGACARGAAGETTGFDDCVEGAVCVNAKCLDICGFDNSANAACAKGDVCTRFAGLFANDPDAPVAGACVASCDPVTQKLGDGGTCGMNRGCYLLTDSVTTQAVCANAGTIQHNQVVNGTAFANSCAPAHQVRRRSDSVTNECGALCAPADVTMGNNEASESGVAPYNCEAQSAASPTPASAPSVVDGGESCRYWWARESFTAASPYSNTVGWCFRHHDFQYDSNGDLTPDAPFPRCTTLTTGDVVPPIQNPPGNDALYFWCIKSQPAPLLPASKPPKANEPRLDRLTGWR